MNLPLIDLHCDTLYEAAKQNKSLTKNDLHLSFERLSKYTPFCQILAVWSDSALCEDGAWEHFFIARENLAGELSQSTAVRLVTCDSELSVCEKEGIGAVMLAVEGGKLIKDDLSRLDTLRESGVRFLTLTWDDQCRICGSNKTGGGLTEFGSLVLLRCMELGIIPDISHASDEASDEVISFMEDRGGICIATHSNSRTVCDHSRNLTDERFIRLARLGGLVGISLAPQHLVPGGNADVDSAVRHIEHYMSLGGEDTVCLGCDLDGIAHPPHGIKSVSDIEKIADALGRINYTEEQIKKIFYANARNFFSLWIK